MTDPLTPAQQKVLDAVLHLSREKGFPPTLKEIGDRCGLSSKATVMVHLQSLEAKGWIRREASARAIQVLEQGEVL